MATDIANSPASGTGSSTVSAGTIMGNLTNGAALPSANSVASVLSRGVQATTLVADQTSVTFSSLDMNAAVGYRIICEFVANCVGNISLQPNANASNGETLRTYTTWNGSAATSGGFRDSTLYVAQAADNPIEADLTLMGSTGFRKLYRANIYYKNSAVSYGFDATGQYTVTSNVTSLVIASDSASGIKTGCKFTLIPILGS